MNDPLTEVRFWAQITGDARRTIICSPDNESRIKTWVDARGMAGILTVHPTPFVDDCTIYVLDEQATEAAHQRDLQREFRRWTGPASRPAMGLMFGGQMLDPKAITKVTEC
jgi:hypothetical protein